MNRHKKLLGVLILILLSTVVAWPTIGAATLELGQESGSTQTADQADSAPSSSLLPPSWAPPSGIAIHQADDGAEQQSSAPEPSFLPSGTFGAGIYAARDYLDLNPAVYPLVGSHRTFYWDELEPVKGQYDWWRIQNFIDAMTAQGKKASFGLSTYSGDFGGLAVPAWYVAGNPGAFVTCNGTHKIPMYWNNNYINNYGDFVAALGQQFDGNPNVAWIQIGTGLYGENQPSHDRYDLCLQSAGLDAITWANTSFAITDLYLQAFDQTPVLFQFAPVYLGDWQRKDCSDYAADRDAGLMHDGLVPDREKAYGSNTACNNQSGHWDPIIKHNSQVPIAFESYLQYLPTATDVYWAMINALAKHSDYVNVGKCLLNVCDQDEVVLTPLQPRTENFPIFRFTNQYLGKTISSTPSVWVALRETELTYCPDAGNFSFWLYQDDDAAGGRTVPAWNVGPEPEGRYTRRTNLATLDQYMYFDVDDGYIYDGANEVDITVRYYDMGVDSWQLDYQAGSNVYKLGGTVVKTDSRQWLTATFHLNDARFTNLQTGGNDFRINAGTTGDEHIHMVDVAKSGVTMAEVGLGSGYNLVSLPVAPTNTALQSVLSSVDGKYTKAFAYINGSWRQYIVGAPPFVNNLTDLTEKLGFWINMTSPDTLRVPGNTPSATDISLSVGSNLVGFPRSAAQPLTEALASIVGKYTKVFANINGQWKQYIVGAPPFVNTLTQLEPGRGYWIYVTEDCIWTITN